MVIKAFLHILLALYTALVLVTLPELLSTQAIPQ